MVWDGTPLDGKRVLVRCDHGLGDTIQFVRYAPLIAAIADQTAWWVPQQLIPLLVTVRGIGLLAPLHDGTPQVEYDVDIESLQLPTAFGTTIDTVPACIPYLHVAPRLLRTGADRNTRLEVGIDASLGALAPIPGIRVHVLNGEPGAGIHTMAQIIKAMDLVIAGDSFIAHLAGALGVPVWTLLPSEPDWRWFAQGEHTPWYPTMRLFRQQNENDWYPVVARIADELSQLAESPSITAA